MCFCVVRVFLEEDSFKNVHSVLFRRTKKHSVYPFVFSDAFSLRLTSTLAAWPVPVTVAMLLDDS